MAMVGVVTILAGLLFGYDQGVIAGALTFFGKEFRLGALLVEVVTSWVALGALAGALVAGTLADRVGRRGALLWAAALFVAGALIQALAPVAAVLIVGRLIVGLGVGVASLAAPLYAAEMAPAATRGRFVSIYQLAITLGILAAYIVDAALTPSGDWRWMFGLAVVPGLLLLVCVTPMPDTPRWLVTAGRRAEARASYATIRGPRDADREIAAMQADLSRREEASWAEVFAPGLRRAIGVGVGLAVFQQVTGINAVIYYANEIFARAGFTSPAAQARATLYAVGVVNVLATLIAVAFVDRFGRKPLLLAGLAGMMASLLVLGGAFLETRAAGAGGSRLGVVTLVCLVVYISSFAFSLGPVVWTLIAEIYPTRVRGRAAAVATAANWGAAFIVSQTFLSLLDAIGAAFTFWLFAAISLGAFVWIARRVPETKGKSLEDIERLWSVKARSLR